MEEHDEIGVNVIMGVSVQVIGSAVRFDFSVRWYEFFKGLGEVFFMVMWGHAFGCELNWIGNLFFYFVLFAALSAVHSIIFSNFFTESAQKIIIFQINYFVGYDDTVWVSTVIHFESFLRPPKSEESENTASQ